MGLPDPSGSKVSKSESMSFLGASKPSSGIALRNSPLVTFPSALVSHSRKRSITWRVRAVVFASADAYGAARLGWGQHYNPTCTTDEQQQAP